MKIYDYQQEQIINFDGYWQLEIDSENRLVKLFSEGNHHEFPLEMSPEEVMTGFAQYTEFWLTKNVKVIT